jgi:hypothetical protein
MLQPRLRSVRPRENRGKREKNRSAEFIEGWREFNLDSPGAKESLRNAEKLAERSSRRNASCFRLEKPYASIVFDSPTLNKRYSDICESHFFVSL